nr:hypothetical protein [uncultured Enterobacter sp.]
MHDVMLFGEGWDGEVRQVEQGLKRFQFVPNPIDTHQREAEFTLIEFFSEDGEVYLVGYSDKEPKTPQVEDAILKNLPTPI